MSSSDACDLCLISAPLRLTPTSHPNVSPSTGMARGAAAKQARKESRKNARMNGDDPTDGQSAASQDNSGLDGYFGPTDGDSTFDIAGEKKKEKKEKKIEEESVPVPAMMGISDGDDPFGFKRQQAAEARRVAAASSCCGDDGCDDDKPKKKEDEVLKKIKKGKKREKVMKEQEAAASTGYFGGIKPLPLLFLLLLTGSTLLPAAFWVLDNAGPMLAKTNLTGRLGHRLGIGATPKKRVTSFYEKHAPGKLHEVDSIVSKYYGDYKTLTKKLERKYQDYGYFVGWEDDEAPSKVSASGRCADVRRHKLTPFGPLIPSPQLALAELDVHVKNMKKYYRRNFPAQIVQAGDNIYYNVGGLVQQGKKVWRKTIWPVLKPLIAIPDEKEAKKQKMKDKKKYGKKPTGRRKKNSEFRDEEED